jgi:sugar lactone lactonase YvrE
MSTIWRSPKEHREQPIAALGAHPSDSKDEKTCGPRIFVLDIGLSAAKPTMHSGSILDCYKDGTIKKVLVREQALPDGLAVDPACGRLFWTNMGVPGKTDGAIYSCNLGGEAVRVVVAPGLINTPKQLALDTAANKVYFCDREGLRVYRCNYDGSELETLFSAGDSEKPEDTQDLNNWCVGVTVGPKLGKFYWTQKGPSKGGRGRIFCAKIPSKPGEPASASGSDVQCILNGLPEPIDLEIDEENHFLYWTDRGELPFGNSLNRVKLEETGLPKKSDTYPTYEILTRHLKEAIGLKLDTERGNIYVTDMGGNIYRCDLDGKNKEKIVSDDFRAFTGITLV